MFQLELLSYLTKTKAARLCISILLCFVLFTMLSFRGDQSSPPSSPSIRYIPKIIHQSWKTTKLPVKFEKWSASWPRNHPSWKYNLWTDADNQKLVEMHYPWFVPFYNKLPGIIHKADVSRYMYLYKYGGVYTDLDVESIAPLDQVLENSQLALCLMGDATWEHSTPNSWMASKPGHSFWMFVLDYVMKHINEHVQTEHQTGPVMIHRVLKEYQKLQDAEPITLLPQAVIHPYNWNFPLGICDAQSEELDTEQCKAKMVVPGVTVAITYWSHSWGGVGMQKLDSTKGI